MASIKEYWIVDGRRAPADPTLLVHRRHGKSWRKTSPEAGALLTT
ncbi:MAG: hypothetical protein AB7K24_34065 [Gemmataceae bacterium]